MQVLRDKNKPTVIVFPLLKRGHLVSNVVNLKATVAGWDGVLLNNITEFHSLNKPLEVKSTGLFYLELTKEETNHDHIIIKITGNEITNQMIHITMINEKEQLIENIITEIWKDA